MPLKQSKKLSRTFFRQAHAICEREINETRYPQEVARGDLVNLIRISTKLIQNLISRGFRLSQKNIIDFQQ